MRSSNLRNMILAGLFAALAGILAQYAFHLPGVGVPVTLQVLVVFLAGGLLGPVWGTVSMAVYVLLGAIGLPVYANGASGLQTLLGPTGGYLFSYPVAALFIGFVAPAARSPRLWQTGLAMLVGLAVIYLGGGGWALLLGGQTFAKVVSLWILPFVPFDLIKLALGAWVATAVNRALVSLGYWADGRA